MILSHLTFTADICRDQCDNSVQLQNRSCMVQGVQLLPGIVCKPEALTALVSSSFCTMSIRVTSTQRHPDLPLIATPSPLL